MGAEPQWAVSGESFPVGCRFHPAIACSQFFSVNPDRRRRMYSTPTGVYRERCGLAAVHMSWSASEYLYMVCSLPSARLVMRPQRRACCAACPAEDLHALHAVSCVQRHLPCILQLLRRFV